MSAPVQFTDDRAAEMLALVKEADDVELKLTIPDTARRSAVVALQLDPLEAQIRQVYFFDTPDLALDRTGVVVRARRTQGRADDSVVKLRPVVPAELPAEVRQAPDFMVEVDAMPGGFVCSGSYKASLPDSPVLGAVTGTKKRIRKMFTKEQRAFFAAHAPEGIQMDDLSVLGPVHVFKLKFSPSDYKRKLVAEMWFYPDGSRVIELSTKCSTAEPFEVAVEAKAYLASKGIDLTAPQQTKTRTALEFFSQELQQAQRQSEAAVSG
jgi:hypothetical protein